MAIMRYEPFQLLNQLQSEINRMFADERGNPLTTGEWSPAVDIKEEEGRYVILADLPGIEPENVEVTLENGILTLKGQRESVKEEEREGYHRVERASGTFYRRFHLPDVADPDKVNAKFNKGVLRIDIEKRATAQPRRISVDVE